VLEALERVASEQAGTEILTKDLRDGMRSFVNGGGVYGSANGKRIDADEIIRDVLYGGYLHGDYDKWQRAKEHRRLIDQPALWSWTQGSETYVRSVASLIRSLDADGTITLGVPTNGLGGD